MPFPIPIIGFSAHVFLVFLGVLLLLPRWRNIPLLRGYVLFLLVLLMLIASSFLVSGAASKIEVQAWATSSAAFILCAACFRFIKQSVVIRAVEVILLITAILAIAQVLTPSFFYVPGWFGSPRVTIYATGLTIYSNQASIMFLPLLMFVLWQNIQRPSLYRYVIWGLGCAGLYLTLSRAGWLAFFIGFSFVAFYAYRVVGGLRNSLINLAVGFAFCSFAWISPTYLDCYEPKGGCSSGRWGILETASQLALHGSSSPPGATNDDLVLVSDYSAATRLITLQVALHAVRNNPMTGVGLGGFPNYYAELRFKQLKKGGEQSKLSVDPRSKMTPHNGYAQLAAEAGLPAFFILLLSITHLLFQGLKSKKNVLIPLMASVSGVLIWLIFHDGFSSRLLWILLGCLASGVYVEKRCDGRLSLLGAKDD